MQQSLSDIFKIIETVSDQEAVEGLVGRYADQLATSGALKDLLERLELRRRALNRWNGMQALVENLRWQKQADLREGLESATQAVLRSENVAQLAAVARNYPVVFSGSMLTSLKMLQEEAAKVGDSYTSRLATSRLRNLQMLHLAEIQGIEITEDNLKILVARVLEAESLHDLLDVVAKNPLVLAEAFDAILKEMSLQAARMGQATVPRVVKLRLDVLNGIRRILEAIVLKRKAAGGMDEAVSELVVANAADQFLDVVARYPFILGEDFQVILNTEMETARDAGEEKAAAGIFRRMGHLNLIGEIVVKLEKSKEMIAAKLAAQSSPQVEESAAEPAQADGLPAGEHPEQAPADSDIPSRPAAEESPASDSGEEEPLDE